MTDKLLHLILMYSSNIFAKEPSAAMKQYTHTHTTPTIQTTKGIQTYIPFGRSGYGESSWSLSGATVGGML